MPSDNNMGYSKLWLDMISLKIIVALIVRNSKCKIYSTLNDKIPLLQDKE